MAQSTLSVRINSEDPFYSPTNMARLEKSIKQLREGKGMEHELAEADEQKPHRTQIHDNALEIAQCGSHYRDK